MPIAWVHKFYLGQYLWGIVYLVLAPTLLPKVACCLEGLWYVSQSDEDFNAKFPAANETIAAVTALAQSSNGPVQIIQKALKIQQPVDSDGSGRAKESPAAAIRELDQLRQEGLITEYEFEQKRRQLLDQIR